MPIACQSELRAAPNMIDLPGSTELTIDLLAAPASATAGVELVIQDEVPVFFASGSKRERLTLVVSASGTRMRHRAQLICRPGVSLHAFTLRAAIFEDGSFQCARACTVGVGSLSCESLPKKAAATRRSTKAKPKRAVKKKTPAKRRAARKRR